MSTLTPEQARAQIEADTAEAAQDWHDHYMAEAQAAVQRGDQAGAAAYQRKAQRFTASTGLTMESIANTTSAAPTGSAAVANDQTPDVAAMLAEAADLCGRYSSSTLAQRYHAAAAQAAAIDQHEHATAHDREQQAQLIAHARAMRGELTEAGLCQ